MGRKKRDYVEKHKQSLEEVLENPATYGVRVSTACCAAAPPAAAAVERSPCLPPCDRVPGFHVLLAQPKPASTYLQTQTRPVKRRKAEAEAAAEEDELLAAEEFVPAAMSGRILREARAQQAELDEEAVPAAAAALAAGGARGLVAAAAKGLRDSDSEDDEDAFSGAAGRRSRVSGPGRRMTPSAHRVLCWTCAPGAAKPAGMALGVTLPFPPIPARPQTALRMGRRTTGRRGWRCRPRTRRRWRPSWPPTLTRTGSARWPTWCWTRFGRSRRRRGWQRCPGAR